MSFDELAGISNTERESVAADAWHQLSHWVADEDIRQRDPAYEAEQRRALLQAIKALSGARSNVR